jgi:hypothetical protein
MSFQYLTVTGDNGVITLNAWRGEGPRPIETVTSTNPNFDKIRRGLDAGDPSVWELFDPAKAVMAKFSQVTERVSFDGSNIRFDGDVREDLVATQIKRLVESGEENVTALARFWEDLETNPEPHSREQAYSWLASHDFKITPEGLVVGYKGVITVDGYDRTNAPEGFADKEFRSTASSVVTGRASAYVNGEPVPEMSYVYQNVGDIVEMPRSEVKHDPYQTCHRGLHIGDWSYGHTYGNTTLEVHFSARDIVSVPVDAGGRKMRVCRYKVIAVADQERGTDSRSPVLEHRPEYEGGYDWTRDVAYRG